jgi:hypothetical protein
VRQCGSVQQCSSVRGSVWHCAAVCGSVSGSAAVRCIINQPNEGGGGILCRLSVLGTSLRIINQQGAARGGVLVA